MINEIIDKLKEDGFEVEYTGYVCGYISDIDLIDHKGRCIQLHASFSKEYEEELESLIDRLLRKYNMNDCWESRSEDNIKIYFSEDKESSRRFLFRAKLETTGEISGKMDMKY